MGTIGKVKLAALEAAGEDEIFGMIAAGKNASDVIAHYNVGWNLFHKWIASGEGRAQRYDEAKQMAGHYYASQAQKIADEIRRSEACAYARDTVAPIRQHIATFGHFRACKCGRSKA